MPRGSNGERRPRGTVEAAIMVAKIATGEAEEKLPDTAKRKARQIGGKSQAALLTPEHRVEIARRAGNSQDSL